MSKYDVSNLSKQIKVGDYVYPHGKEHQVVDKFKEVSNMDGKARSGTRIIWWVTLKSEDGKVKAYPVTEIAKAMLG